MVSYCHVLQETKRTFCAKATFFVCNRYIKQNEKAPFYSGRICGAALARSRRCQLSRSIAATTIADNKPSKTIGVMIAAATVEAGRHKTKIAATARTRRAAATDAIAMSAGAPGAMSAPKRATTNRCTTAIISAIAGIPARLRRRVIMTGGCVSAIGHGRAAKGWVITVRAIPRWITANTVCVRRPRGYHWVRDHDGDFLLAAVVGGLIAQVILNSSHR